MKRAQIPRAVWQTIRSEYTESGLSCRELAEKHGLNPQTVSTRCKREGWRQEEAEGARRLAIRTEQALDQKAEDTADRAVAFESRAQREAEQWMDRIEEAFRSEKNYDAIEAMQKLLPQWKVVVELGRKAYRLDRESPIQPMINIGLMAGGLPPLLKDVILVSDDANGLPNEVSGERPPKAPRGEPLLGEGTQGYDYPGEGIGKALDLDNERIVCAKVCTDDDATGILMRGR